MEFLRGLRDRGFADTALDYLDAIEKRSDLPPDIREVLDLERCTTLRAAAQTAYDPRQSEHYLADAQRYMDKFLKEHPGNAHAGVAMMSWGDFALERAQQLLGTARGTPDKAKQEKLLSEARANLNEAGERFVDARKRFQAQLAQLPKEDLPSPRIQGRNLRSAPTQRQDVELSAVEARFKAALVSYYLAQTYADPKNPERKETLKKAAKQFDDIFQEYRNNVNEVCVLAHLWQGRVLEEMGDLRTAMEIFDEVLVNSPDTGAGDSDLASLYSQAEYFRLRAAAKLGKPSDVFAEANRWLTGHKGWRRTAAYQGIALESARAQMTLAEKASGEPRTKLLQQAARTLADIAKIESEYRQEAILMRRDVLKALGSENINSDEFLALGDSALAAGQTSEAEENYNQALQRATEAKDEKRAAEVRLRLSHLRYTQALALYTGGKYDEAVKAAGAIAREDAADPSTSNAAALALSSVLKLYGGAKDQPAKQTALERLEKIADFVIRKWPDRPEADDARMALAQARLWRGETDAAMALLGQVNSGSTRYPVARDVMGQIHWSTFLAEKKKDDGERNQQRMEQSRSKARECLQDAVRLLKDDPMAEHKAAPGSEGESESSRPSQLAEAQLLLAEILLESKEYRQALDLLNPLVERIRAAKPKSIDTPTFRTFMAAVRAHMALGETDKGAEIALMLVQLSEDTAKVNGVLVNFAKLVGQELKRAEAAVTEAQGGDLKVLNDVLAKRDAVRLLLSKVLEPLAGRKEHSLGDMVYLGDTCAALGLSDQARQQYQRILDKAQADEAFAKTADRALVRVRAQLVGLLRAQGKFEEAAKQADELIAKNPRALEPKMVKAYILEDWAKRDPSKYDAAVSQWTDIRVLLGRQVRKPPEYYEVIYKVASCLYEQYQKTSDKTKLNQAEQLLKSTLILNSKLSGPDLVAQYNELLKRIATAQGNKDKQAAKL